MSEEAEIGAGKRALSLKTTFLIRRYVFFIENYLIRRTWTNLVFSLLYFFLFCRSFEFISINLSTDNTMMWNTDPFPAVLIRIQFSFVGRIRVVSDWTLAKIVQYCIIFGLYLWDRNQKDRLTVSDPHPLQKKRTQI